MDKRKIKPWLLPIEEVERMPGVTLEDLKKARYGDTAYPTVWYEKYPNTFYGRLIVAHYLYVTRKGTIRNTLIRAYLFRAISKLLGKGARKRAYQHASFWLFSSTTKYLNRSYRRYIKAQNQLYFVRRSNEKAKKAKGKSKQGGRNARKGHTNLTLRRSRVSTSRE